jgi:hypothetical protein
MVHNRCLAGVLEPEHDTLGEFEYTLKRLLPSASLEIFDDDQLISYISSRPFNQAKIDYYVKQIRKKQESAMVRSVQTVHAKKRRKTSGEREV